MADDANKRREIFGRALVESTEETSTMMHALITHLMGLVLKNKDLDDAEKAHLCANQIVCILGILNAHLEQIGTGNFNVVSRQIQELMKRERTGVAKQAGLSRLSALLLPLTPISPTKN
jgi:hypothetical protein